MAESKAEVRARIGELKRTLSGLGNGDFVVSRIRDRIQELEREEVRAEEDNLRSVIRSHKAVCEAKGMDEKAAYGQDPALFYSLAICGEAGEMGNKIVKGLRNGNDPDASRRAIESELPDVFIYGFVLAHVLDIDVVKLVNEKVDVVIQRAIDGYYGGKLPGRE
jgi:NTP pyrophosphatase (non-canonical NTP hydrolase)